MVSVALQAKDVDPGKAEIIDLSAEARRRANRGRPEAVDGHKAAVNAPAGQKKILIVEDEALIAELYASVLKKRGYAVTLAADGVYGLEAIRSHDFDLILLDIRMPRVDGMEVLRTMAEEGRDGAPVVILTNFDDPTLHKEAMSLGVKELLLKSRIMPMQLADRIPGWIGPQT